MKAMRNSPEWMSKKIDKYGKEIKGLPKNQKDEEKIVPFGMMEDFQVHAQGYVPGLGRVDARHGNGPETLFAQLGTVKSALDVENAAHGIHAAILKGEGNK